MTGHNEKTKYIGSADLITLDFIYSGLPKIPGMGEEVSTGTFSMALGGGPTATVITAERLGAKTKLVTSLGKDHVSGIAKELLEMENTAYVICPAMEEASPVNVTSVMTFAHSDRAFVSYFPKINFLKDYRDEIYAHLHDAEICVFSRPNAELFKRLCGNGCKIAYDVGWNDNLSLDSIKDILRSVYLFTPNEKEAAKLTGKSNAESALRMLADYVELPIVKLGDNGAMVWNNGNIEHVPPYRFDAADSTGAGDAFLGGVIFGMLNGWDIIECVELGNYAGGKAASKTGCLSARVSLGEFNEMRTAR